MFNLADLERDLEAGDLDFDPDSERFLPADLDLVLDFERLFCDGERLFGDFDRPLGD